MCSPPSLTFFGGEKEEKSVQRSEFTLERTQGGFENAFSSWPILFLTTGLVIYVCPHTHVNTISELETAMRYFVLSWNAKFGFGILGIFVRLSPCCFEKRVIEIQWRQAKEEETENGLILEATCPQKVFFLFTLPLFWPLGQLQWQKILL